MSTSAQEALRAKGLRVTPPRLAVLNALQKAPHSSAETLFKTIHPTIPTLYLSTTHDVINDLCRVELIRRVSLPDTNHSLYELAEGADNHHHLQCIQCGRLEDIECAIGAAPCLHPVNDHGMRVLEATVTYRALCAQCETPKNPIERTKK